MKPCKHCGKYLCDCEKWSEHVKQATPPFEMRDMTQAERDNLASYYRGKLQKLESATPRVPGTWCEKHRQATPPVCGREVSRFAGAPLLCTLPVDHEGFCTTAPRPVVDEEAEKGQRERCKQWLHDEGLLQWCDGDEEISSLLEFVRTEAARAAKEGKE